MNKKIYRNIFLIQLLGIFHCVEEYFFGFSSWATKHFGTVTQNYYLWSHIFLAVFFGIVAFYFLKGYKWAIFAALTIQILLFTNGLFHIFTTILWKEYSPGVFTQIIVTPISYIVFKKYYDNRLLSNKEIISSVLTGSFISGIIISSLYFNIPF